MADKPNLFTITGCHTALIKPDDPGELQLLLEKCADYNIMLSGSSPKPTAAVTMLADCPPGKTLADKLVVGFSTNEYGLIGVLDAIRDYPTRDDWWLGLLLLEPAQRNKGLGKRIYQSFEHWAKRQGARRIFLGVLEENQKAYNFWQTMEFDMIERQPSRQFGNLSHVVITMVRNLSELLHD